MSNVELKYKFLFTSTKMVKVKKKVNIYSGNREFISGMRHRTLPGWQ